MSKQVKVTDLKTGKSSPMSKRAFDSSLKNATIIKGGKKVKRYNAEAIEKEEKSSGEKPKSTNDLLIEKINLAQSEEDVKTLVGDNTTKKVTEAAQAKIEALAKN